MFNKYLLLLKLLAIIFVASLLLNYSYYRCFQVSADSKTNHNPPTAVVTKSDAGQPYKNPPQSAQLLELPQSPAAPAAIPILMYHEIGDGPNSLYVADQRFSEQMLYLYNHGYQVVSLTQAREMLFAGESCSKVVALTFDDGYRSFYAKVWPLLKIYNFSATVFVITDFIGQGNYLSWDQIKEMNHNGIDIGSHSLNHPSLPCLNTAGLIQQISASKDCLEINGINTKSFCYPSGQYNKSTVNQVVNSGYQSAVTTKYGIASSNDSPYLLPRLRVSRGTSLQSFQKSIEN